MNYFLSLFNRIFKSRFSPKLIDGKYKIELAFTLAGKEYFHFPDQFQVPAGRHMAALAFYEELNMRCDQEYLNKHVKAMGKLLSDPKKINLQAIMQINMNLEERLELIPLPDYILRVASVVFFDLSESIYSYDFDYNKKKIERWKKDKDVLGFFLTTPLVELMPSLKSAIENSRTYSPVTEKIDAIHQANLTAVLSEKV